MTILFMFEKYTHIKRILELYNDIVKQDQWGNKKGHVIQLHNTYVFVPCVGCMHVLNNLYTLVEAYQIDCVIRVGTCGVLSDKIALGEVVIIEKSINKDALSEKFFPNIEPKVSIGISRKIQDCIEIKLKTTYTIDVLWEKPDKSADVVDMETSALYCYGRKNDLECVSISVCRDSSAGRITKEMMERTIKETVQSIINMFEK